MASKEQTPHRRRLDLGWKLMVAFGAHWVVLSIVMPLASVLALPGQPEATFAAGDERFTGISWTQIGSLSPNLALWMVLTKVSMSAMMCGLAILIVALAYRPYRRGERWAWRALLAATLIPIAVYYGSICAAHVSHGLPIWKYRPGSSGVMADLVNVFVLVWLYFGLWYPRNEVTA